MRPPQRPVALALRALNLGDLLVVVPALRALAPAHPRRRLLLAAPRSLGPPPAPHGAMTFPATGAHCVMAP
ncbi:hypothetical protein [Pseudonocardia asaccharolytica]|uniref:Glycosyltransferase family 9 protein n=1 Tax=Pseudonocardia asaccharolytica DSM 44247 = NBRC 16224 TaxID=1123024 RepID=A0A511D565_9PSEU|nr:hypothetical protein [Pseudonocardia asaccharolytica]GEL19936.1 hypothetical protein PA7_37730 [Pseudonocardia asaccharolytica DSM 44247 = NBRC 16224]